MKVEIEPHVKEPEPRRCPKCLRGTLHAQKCTFRERSSKEEGMIITRSWTLFGYYFYKCDFCGSKYAVDPETLNYLDLKDLE
jgi:hypothetical protein